MTIYVKRLEVLVSRDVQQPARAPRCCVDRRREARSSRRSRRPAPRASDRATRRPMTAPSIRSSSARSSTSGGTEPVEIHVLERDAAAVLLDDRERRTRDVVAVAAESYRRAPHERGLARTERTFEQDDRAGREPSTQRRGRAAIVAASESVMVERSRLRVGSRRVTGEPARAARPRRATTSPAIMPVCPSSAAARSPARPCRYTASVVAGSTSPSWRDPGGDRPGEHVAGAAGRHAGIAGQVDEHVARRRSRSTCDGPSGRGARRA